MKRLAKPRIMPTGRAYLLRRRLDRLTRPLPALEDGDVPALHRARVASRRLRELVPMLQIDGDVARKRDEARKRIFDRLPIAGMWRVAKRIERLADELEEIEQTGGVSVARRW